MVRMAAKHADGVLYNGAHPRDYEWAAERVAEGLDARPDDRGEFDFAAYAPVSVAGDREAAREVARYPVAFVVGSAPDPVLDRHGIDRETAREVGEAEMEALIDGHDGVVEFEDMGSWTGRISYLGFNNWPLVVDGAIVRHPISGRRYLIGLGLASVQYLFQENLDATAVVSPAFPVIDDFWQRIESERPDRAIRGDLPAVGSRRFGQGVDGAGGVHGQGDRPAALAGAVVHDQRPGKAALLGGGHRRPFEFIRPGEIVRQRDDAGCVSEGDHGRSLGSAGGWQEIGSAQCTRLASRPRASSNASTSLWLSA
jgi:hypothetical protein